jgi:hypothetical protein
VHWKLSPAIKLGEGGGVGPCRTFLAIHALGKYLEMPGFISLGGSRKSPEGLYPQSASSDRTTSGERKLETPDKLRRGCFVRDCESGEYPQTDKTTAANFECEGRYQPEPPIRIRSMLRCDELETA